MPSTYSSSLRLELQAAGENTNTWGTIANTVFSLLDAAVAGVSAVSFSSDANKTLTANNGSSDESRAAVLSVTSGVSLTATRDLIVPTVTKVYLVYNNTTGSQSIRVKTSAGSGITIPNGKKMIVYCDGTNVVDGINNLPSGTTIDGSTVYLVGGADVSLADGGTGTSLTDPNADRIMFWDDSAGAVTWLSMGAGISISDTTLTLDSDLQTWAGVTPSANGQSLVSAANYAAMRALLDLEAGTDFLSPAAIAAAYQPLDTTLTNFAANTGVSGTVTVSTSSPSGGSDGDVWFKYT